MYHKPEPITIDNTLTIIVRNDGPMDYAGDSPTYRSVHIKLTDEQRKQVMLQPTHSHGSTWFFEEVSKCFIERLSSDDC